MSHHKSSSSSLLSSSVQSKLALGGFIITVGFIGTSLYRSYSKKRITSRKKKLNQPIKSFCDDRSYRYMELSNHLQVLLICDPTTDKSAACLNVHVGTFSDPENLQGLAHFCEHMLFLGSKKYPGENSYTKFICSHGGDDNASTDNENTEYFFDIQPNFFEEALDRFASQFIGPLFTESATGREMEAVHSEFTKKIESR